jgi:hypothetical protein
LSKSPPQSGKLVQFKAKPSRGRDPEVASTEQPECPQCASLRAACDELRVRTDDALKALAEEREVSNALRLGYSAPYHYIGAHVRHRRGERPLRYDLADATNDIFKTYFGFLHTAARVTASRIYQVAKRLGRNIEP